MTPTLRAALHYARLVPHDRTALSKMFAALYLVTGPRRDGSVVFTLRSIK